MYKLVALDMDGTLLNSDKIITDRNKQAIANAREKGVTVILASGRPLAGMREKLEELQLTSDKDFVVSSNGSYVHRVSDNKEIHSQIITGKEAKHVAKLAEQLGVHMHAFSIEHGLITPKNNPYTEHEAVINGLSIKEFDFSQLDDDHQIIKAMFADAPEELDRVTPLLDKELHNEFTIVRSAHIFLEFLHLESNKGVGVAAVAKYLGINADEVISMGDAENDHHMMKYAGLGVAMGNATKETKALADHITDTHDNSGVAQVIEEFILNV
ncbi:Cof-type HAD-IIB family hydrolase [Vibrio algarum]|uniref:Cof-type HAD-IIB family hydrolase n=1 Tax=Vibrio algarum TaxID=3020714 RepID=A0ABT4YQJ6_9VIBR|nr:Cof-type HAD-IIB family hydrolase [Vibrio sp. KJ40-1]MDB1123826.1 Cof-type HAD-IIB family hydrolase [Vibrio sp. KJ40-1]